MLCYPIVITAPDKRTPLSQIEEMAITLPIPKTFAQTKGYIGNDVGKGLESIEQNLKSQSSTHQVQGLKIYYGLISGRKTLFYENTNSQTQDQINPPTLYWCDCSSKQAYIDNGDSIIKITMLWRNTNANRGKEFNQILSTFKFTN